MRNLIRSLWIRARLRGVGFADRGDRLDSLYRVADPWDMASDREQYRFRETAEVCARWIGRTPSILEVGCGEGHQTKSLEPLTDAIYGVDVSERAVIRARTRCPHANFATTEPTRLVLPAAWPRRFGLVTLCEVAYYASDPEALMHAASAAGDSCLLTYFAPRGERLDPIVRRFPIVDRHEACFGETKWIMVWWRNSRPS